ncbi:hypothetical protein PG985_000222 [Apiospora marii]|uniref:Uncharacterized protein n=1 Tax=Apiospora marii TaxID=335849 RepID=A0ABR1R1H9_9PEZI
MSSTSLLSATTTTSSSADSETSTSSSTESPSSSSDTFTISSTSSISSDLPSTTETPTSSSSTSSSTSSSAFASASASADPPPPPPGPTSGHDFCLIIDAPGEDFDGAIVITYGSSPPYALIFKSYDDSYTPAAYFDLDGPTGRLILSSSRSAPPSQALVPFLPTPHSDQNPVLLDEAYLIDTQPDVYLEMRCVAPAGSSAINPATDNLIPECAIECMASATLEGRYYGGVSYGDNTELLMIDDDLGLTQYRFKVGYEDGACMPAS